MLFKIYFSFLAAQVQLLTECYKERVQNITCPYKCVIYSWTRMQNTNILHQNTNEISYKTNTMEQTIVCLVYKERGRSLFIFFSSFTLLVNRHKLLLLLTP